MKIKWNRRALFSSVGLFLVLPLLVGALMLWKMFAVIRSSVESRVSDQAAVLAQLASSRLDDRLDEMERVASYLTRLDEEEMGGALDRLLNAPSQISAGILRLDGTPVSGRALLSTEYPAIQAAFQGTRFARYRRGEGLLFTAPVYSGNGTTVKYALYDFFDQYALFRDFGKGCFEDEAMLMLADRDQHIVIPISDAPTETDSFFQRPQVKDAFFALGQRRTENAPSVYCRSPGREDLLFISQLTQSNLFLVGVVPYGAVAGGVSSLPGMVLLVFGLLLVLLCLGVVRVIHADAKARESDELRQAKATAEEASRSKSNFLANMSHELRTPINTIMGMDEMILRETREPETRERAMDVRSAAQILLGLINDVLDFSKIESGMLKIIPVEYNLVTLIRDLDLLSENRARAKSLDFRMDIQPDLPVGLFGDDIRLRQVLVNLLTNAVKYTNEGGVTLRIAGTRFSQDTLSLHCEVIDTGIGIKAEDMPRGFEPYRRIEEARNRNVEGSGLGLPIITNLLRLMGSELQLRSVYGKGSTFFFDVEQKIVDPEPIGDIHRRLDNMVKQYEYRVGLLAPDARVLVVDDNAMNRKIFGSLLKQTQVQVTTASSGPKCLDLVRREHFDLIFMDHLMPGMDGVETLHRLKELEGNLCRDTPVIALTANAFTGAREKYIGLGFDAFLAKPIVSEKLEAMLREMLPKELLKNIPLPAVPDQNQAGESALPAVDGINWDYARINIHDDELLLESLRMFYQNLDGEYRDVGELSARLDAQDGLDNFRIRVHSLKSTAAMVGALTVSELARVLEFAAKEDRTDKIAGVTPALLEELLKMKERLAPLFQAKEEKKPLEDRSQLLALLDMLRIAMENMDIQAADAALAQINSYAYDAELQETISRLSSLEANLDFDGAGRIAGQLLEQLMSGSSPEKGK